MDKIIKDLIEQKQEVIDGEGFIHVDDLKAFFLTHEIKRKPIVTPNDAVIRTHDDNDGDMSETLQVMSGSDGDIWLHVNKMGSLRFRTPTFGGGRSPKTYYALVNLLNAMKEDNEDSPLLP